MRMIFGSADPTGTPELWARFIGHLPNGELVLVPMPATNPGGTNLRRSEPGRQFPGFRLSTAAAFAIAQEV